MRKILWAPLYLFILFLLSSCSYFTIGGTLEVVAPENKSIPIEGEWRVESFKEASSYSGDSEDTGKIGWLGKAAVFDSQLAVLGEDYCIDPSYKVKNVSTLDYLLYKYKVEPQFLDIDAPKIQVVTVTQENQSFREFIKVKEDQIIVQIDGVFYYLKKISDEIDEVYRYKYKEHVAAEGNDAAYPKEKSSSGILLGLRYLSSGSSKQHGETAYRTLWISFEGGSPGTIYEGKDLFVPRKSGFWKLGTVDGGKTLYACAVDKNLLKAEEGESIGIESYLSSSRTILYTGNDYVSTEYTEKSPDGSVVKSILQLLPIDNLFNSSGVEISHVAGEQGSIALRDSARNYFKDPYLLPDEQNYGITRRNGHFIMKGRINRPGEGSYEEFIIKAIPPPTLVAYDELALPWRAVKEKVPEALDVYTSPNRDMAIVITDRHVLVYSIIGRELSSKPLKRVELKEGETVVMAEWALGRYTEKWQDEFIKNGAREIE